MTTMISTLWENGSLIPVVLLVALSGVFMALLGVRRLSDEWIEREDEWAEETIIWLRSMK